MLLAAVSLEPFLVSVYLGGNRHEHSQHDQVMMVKGNVGHP